MKIEFDNSLAKITGIDQDKWDSIRRGTKVEAPGVKYMPTYKLYKKSKGKAGWDGRVTPLGKDGLFPTGLVPYVQDLIYQGTGSVASLSDKRIIDDLFIGKTSVKLRGYQTEAIDKSLNHQYNSMWWPRGVIRLATGGGKTEIAAAMYQQTGVRTLFVVHRKDLMHQTHDRFSKYGVNTGIVGDGRLQIDPDINVCTIQSIATAMKKKVDLSPILEAEQVFFDEAHLIAAKLAGGNQLARFSGMLKHAHMRWGLTATPFMKDTYSNLILEAVTGKTLYSISNADLISQGYLTPAKVKVYTMPNVPCPKKWPDCYDKGVVMNTYRNDSIIEILKGLPKPCFVMVTQVAHAKILNRMAQAEGIELPMLTGSSHTGHRKEMLAKLANGDLDQIVCSTIFDEGLDLPELASLILAGAGKSEIKMLQRAGRGLRKHSTKQVFTLVDFIDTAAPILQKHSEQRGKVWVQEGFEIEKYKA